MKKDSGNIVLFVQFSHNSNNSTLPNSRTISFEFFWMGCRRFSAASRHEVFSMKMIFDPFTSSWTRRCSASSTIACDSLHTLKSILCSTSWSTVTGLPVPVWSFSTCLGVNMQRFVDFCPDKGLSVLVGSVTSSCFSWLRVSRSNLEHSRVSSTHLVKKVSLYLISEYWVLVRFVGCLCCFQQYQNLNRTSNYLCRKSSVVVEVTHTHSGMWFLQIPSGQLSGYNKLGVYRRGWFRSILFEQNFNPFRWANCTSTQYTVSWCTFHFCLYDARRGLVKSSSCGSLWSFFMGFTAVKNTVCLSLLEFCPPAINPKFVMECTLTAHPKW